MGLALVVVRAVRTVLRLRLGLLGLRPYIRWYEREFRSGVAPGRREEVGPTALGHLRRLRPRDGSTEPTGPTGSINSSWSTVSTTGIPRVSSASLVGGTS